MSFKFLYYTDVHFWSKNPKSRRDDYPTAILRKLEAVRDYGDQFKVDAFFDGGDLIHRPNLGIRGVNALLSVLRGRCAPTYAVIGNHPIEKGNAESWRPFSAFQTIQLAFELDQAREAIYEEYKCEPMFQFKDPLLYDHPVPHYRQVIRLHHVQLVQKSMIWDHVLWKDYDPGPATIVLCSDYHGFQGHEIVNGVHFISPGAVCRNTHGPDDMTREPKCAVVTITDKGAVHVEFLELPHESGSKVFCKEGTFDRKEVEKDETHLRECVQHMRQMAESGLGMGPEEMLRSVARGLNVGEDALAYAMNVLDRTDGGS